MMQLFTQQILNETPRSNITSLSCPIQSSPNTSLSCPTPVMPANLAKSPHLWTKDEVGAWLAWCSEEYSIDSVNPERFSMNGRAVCLLNRDDFMQRAPEVGDLLYNTLQILIKQSSKNFIPSIPQVHPSLIIMPSSPTLQNAPNHHFNVPILSPIQSAPSLSVPECYSQNIPNLRNVSSPPSCTDGESVPSESSSVTDNEDMETQDLQEADSKENNNFETNSEPQNGMHTTKRDSDCRLLWEFIYHLLLNKKNSSFICWEDEQQYIFRIVNPHGLAELWGAQKSRSTMTYEKLSRALRYYYKMDIIRKVPGKRLTYQFMHPPKDIKKGQRGARPQYKTDSYNSMTNSSYVKHLSLSQANVNNVYQLNQPSHLMDNMVPEIREPSVDNGVNCHTSKTVSNNIVLLPSSQDLNGTNFFTNCSMVVNGNGEDNLLMKKISQISVENSTKPSNLNESRPKFILPNPDFIKRSSSPSVIPAVPSTPSPSLPSLMTNTSTSPITTTAPITPTTLTIPVTSATTTETNNKHTDGAMVPSNFIHPADIKTESYYEQYSSKISPQMNECHKVTSPNWSLGIKIKEQDEPQDLSMRTLQKHNMVTSESA
ncbi:transcription factor ETV6-like isoform X4 [Octopus vulgaris]|uniref:Transcription factor ETV6-like isoform X4 n=1 Tax=Octopus vulgaris TaxID=6645 RepID=A0AA36AZN2_OCTVU|nr:transcription factor ETV6-like isoform X4 [Octopus vulgaris]